MLTICPLTLLDASSFACTPNPLFWQRICTVPGSPSLRLLSSPRGRWGAWSHCCDCQGATHHTPTPFTQCRARGSLRTNSGWHGSNSANRYIRTVHDLLLHGHTVCNALYHNPHYDCRACSRKRSSCPCSVQLCSQPRRPAACSAVDEGLPACTSFCAQLLAALLGGAPASPGALCPCTLYLTNAALPSSPTACS